MHVVLIILKVLGITLLILLGIILLLVLLLLVAPFRYTVDAEYYGDINAVARIRWLIFVLDLKGVYGENKFLYYLKSFWFTISTNDENDKHYKSGLEENKSSGHKLFAKKDKQSEDSGKHTGKKTGKDTKEKPVVVSEDDDFEAFMAEQTEDAKTDEKLPQAAQSVSGKEDQEQNITDSEHLLTQQSDDTVGTEETAEKEAEERKGIFTTIREKLEYALEWVTTIPMKIHYKIGEIFTKILDFFANINENINNLGGKIEDLDQKKDDILKKVRKVQKLIQMDSTKHAVKSVIKYLKQILKHVAPRKYNGMVHFGMEDPSTTGQVVGVFGALLPIYKDHIVVRPDFENKIMEGELHLKGRIRIGFFAIIAVKALLNRDLIKTVKRVKTIVEA